MTIVKKLPKGVELSPYLRERAKFYIRITSFGRPMFIAATKHVLIALSLNERGQLASYKKRYDFDIEKGFRDIINSLELQVRDNVMQGIEENVTRTLLGKMSEAMRPRIQATIEEQTKLIG